MAMRGWQIFDIAPAIVYLVYKQYTDAGEVAALSRRTRWKIQINCITADISITNIVCTLLVATSKSSKQHLSQRDSFIQHYATEYTG